MKLPSVEYEAPATVAEAVGLLAQHQDEASVLAGGQSLIPLLALRLARPAVLIDINGLDELSGVSVTDGRVAIGAMTREYVAEESETVADTVPARLGCPDGGLAEGYIHGFNNLIEAVRQMRGELPDDVRELANVERAREPT